jgi:hypothetical protein
MVELVDQRRRVGREPTQLEKLQVKERGTVWYRNEIIPRIDVNPGRDVMGVVCILHTLIDVAYIFSLLQSP